MKLFLTLPLASLLLFTPFVQADVVKPALVEVIFYADNSLKLEIDLSLEAAMCGIGTKYKSTLDSPNSDCYDELRALEPEILRQKFHKFEQEFKDSFELLVKVNSRNNKAIGLQLNAAQIDIVGYKQRPRKTILTYTAKLNERPENFSWKYPQIYGDNALRFQVYKKDRYNWSDWQWLRNGATSDLIKINAPKPQSLVDRVKQFIVIGFEHVIPLGWDHILFIIGMALSSLVVRNLIILTATFTLAHTITLGLATAEVVSIPANIVEPLIAFSIAYVAIENLYKKLAIKRKSIIVFLFGLVHGLGFASMLKEFDMAENNFLTTLISFNIGVELAQVLIVLLVVLTLLGLRALKLNYRQLAIIPISVTISMFGLWLGIERLIN